MPRGEVLYYVYRNKDDMLMANGNAEQCAYQMGKSVSNFRGMVSRAVSGEIKKWTVEKYIQYEVPFSCARCPEYQRKIKGKGHIGEYGKCKILNKSTNQIKVTVERLNGCPKEKVEE